MDTIDSWWQENRGASPDLFVEELDRTLHRLGRVPAIGTPHLSRPGVRKLLLPRSRYHVYYEVHDELREVHVLAVWHTSRGGEPDLG